MHKVDQTVLDAIGIYEASCEAAGAPISAGAKIAAVSAALATHATPEEVTARLMQFASNSVMFASASEDAEREAFRREADEPRPARKPRASKGAK